jgi:hypothetical protein
LGWALRHFGWHQSPQVFLSLDLGIIIIIIIEATMEVSTPGFPTQ